MRGVVMAGVIALLGCGTAPAPEPAAPTHSAEAKQATVAETASEPVGTWWCMTMSPQMGGCDPTEHRCHNVRVHLLGAKQASDPDLAPCTATHEVACFDADGIRGPRAVCHPTLEICRSHRDHFHPDGEHATGDCALTTAGPSHAGD